MSVSVKGTLLLVEDDADTRALLERVLNHAGFIVRSASNGFEASRKARAFEPDLIVLDLMLPWLSGPEFLQQMHVDRSLAKIPVIVMTGTNIPEHEVTGFQNVRGFLRKPFDEQRLVEDVFRILYPRRSVSSVES